MALIPGNTKRKGRRRACLVAIVFVTLILLVMAAIIARFTVFKPKKPITIVHSVTVENVKVALGFPKLSFSMNITLLVDLFVKNPNRVDFSYSNSSATVNYRGGLVGDAPIPAGKISAGEEKPISLNFTLLADRLLEDKNLYSGVMNGSLLLVTETRIPGEVRVLHFLKFHAVSNSTCDLSVDVLTWKVGNTVCRYETKL